MSCRKTWSISPACFHPPRSMLIRRQKTGWSSFSTILSFFLSNRSYFSREIDMEKGYLFTFICIKVNKDKGLPIKINLRFTQKGESS